MASLLKRLFTTTTTTTEDEDEDQDAKNFPNVRFISRKSLAVLRTLGGKPSVKLCKFQKQDEEILVVVKESSSELDLLCNAITPSPFIVSVIGRVCFPSGIVLEYLELGTLESFISKNKEDFFKTTTPKQKIRFCLDALQALSHVHNCGVIIRDLAMRNLMVVNSKNGDQFGLKLIDLGWSLILKQGEERERMSKQMDSLFAAPWRVLAPESASSSGSCVFSTESDVWSFGILCFGIVTCERPYNDITREDIQSVVASGIGPGLQHLNKVSSVNELKQICSMITHCLSVDPKKRPTVPQLLDELLNLYSKCQMN